MDKIGKLAAALNYAVFVEYTCERALHFFNSCVAPKWKAWREKKEGDWPFHSYKEYASEETYRCDIERLFNRARALIPLE